MDTYCMGRINRSSTRGWRGYRGLPGGWWGCSRWRCDRLHWGRGFLRRQQPLDGCPHHLQILHTVAIVFLKQNGKRQEKQQKMLSLRAETLHKAAAVLRKTGKTQGKMLLLCDQSQHQAAAVLQKMGKAHEHEQNMLLIAGDSPHTMRTLSLSACQHDCQRSA